MDAIECFISVDVETSGPIPGEYSLLSIGACSVSAPHITFERLIKPISRKIDPEALKVTGFSLEDLKERGADPKAAFEDFATWLSEVSPHPQMPIFVGFNAAFDWSFINYYFHRYIGKNPFGFAALDIKSLYMGRKNTSWRETKSSAIIDRLNPVLRSNHNALDDAKFQAELFRLIMKGD